MKTLRLAAMALLVAACVGPTATVRPSQITTGLPTAIPTAGPTEGPTGEPTTAPTQTDDRSTPQTGPTQEASAEPTTGPALNLTLSAEPWLELDTPLTFFTSDGAGTHYAVGQEGVIRVVGLDGAVQEQPLLDISDRLVSGGEQGLLGLAFHPDYGSNGRFFVNYTDREGDTVVSEFARADSPDGVLADPDSERIVLTIQQPFANHNGGMIAFGPDGDLYIGMGDGGSGGDPMGNGQARASLLGKMLRIDVNSGDPYGIPSDNPFVNSDALPEIWSLGWRNPWRFSFDLSGGGDLFVGDVGQGQVEEIDVEPRGEGGRNYGWNTMEGDLCFRTDPCDQTGLTLPVVANHRERGECAIIGGYVYRGTQFPDLQGAYLYSDNCSGDIWGFDAAAVASGSADPVVLAETSIGPTSFGEDENHELYLVNGGGSIYKLIAERIRP